MFVLSYNLMNVSLVNNTYGVFISYGVSHFLVANPLVLNDDCQTPLEVARVKGFSNVVRAIEVCL